MRVTTHRERRLAILFGLAVFILLNLMLLVFLKRHRADAERELATLESRKEQADMLMLDPHYWDSRADWLEQNRPVFALSGDAQTELLETLQSTPREHGLEATPPIIDDPRSYGTFEEVSATVKVTGDIRNVVAWLAQIQQPGKFNAVTNVTVQSDKDAPRVVCEVRVAKWFFIGDPAANPPAGDPATSATGLPAVAPTPGLILPAISR